MTADGAAAVEILRAELARAKEQAWISNAVAEKASVKLKAEQAARHQYEEKISLMTLELEDAANRCGLLERDIKAKWLILTRPYKRQEKPGPNLKRTGRRSGKLGRSRLVSPFYNKLSSAIRIMPRLIKCGVLQMLYWICQRVLPMLRSFTKCKKGMQRRSFSGRNLVRQSAHCC